MIKESKSRTNRYIVSVINELVSFMEVHDTDSRKAKSFQNAIFNLERFKKPLSEQPDDEILSIGGVGKSTLKLIHEILDTGTAEDLENLKKETPEGVQELMGLSGIGPGKIKVLWNTYGIEDIETFSELIYSGKILEIKGFGEKTVAKIKENLEFYISNKNKVLLPEALDIIEQIADEFPTDLFPTGEVRRKCQIVSTLEFLVADNNWNELLAFIDTSNLFISDKIIKSPLTSSVLFKEPSVSIVFHKSSNDTLERDKVVTTGSEDHLRWLNSKGFNPFLLKDLDSEKKFYINNTGGEVLPEHREGFLEEEVLPENLITDNDLKGIIHNHSTYSDGANTLREMAEATRDMGYEYFGIADHSRSAFFYANGLYEERVLKQHEEIDELNRELAPFKIFKGIESDILTDGSLDYEPDILERFDYIVASVHGSLNMDIKTATERILKAIENPYTTILGHLTGRLLLKRKGYPVDHKTIIEACAKNNVAIELNAHPIRLDLDWKWIRFAVEKGVMMSINPDAHAIDGLDMSYGVMAGRKGGLTKEMTLNAKGTKEIESYFKSRKN